MTLIPCDQLFSQKVHVVVKKLLISLMCLALISSTVEKVIIGFGFLSDLDFSVVELVENEEKNKESEKEENNKKELQEAEFLSHRYSFSLNHNWAFFQNISFYQSHVDDVPSPPPNHSC